ncbi:type II secretion system protein [Izhakiella australiensis]|uniref:Type II secretion system protein n=1 Tax=Izhakiella australiensis TaxID=1926881 RepID=A0A1S8YRA9_9GAMM|nr:type II secretion system F family protein [Izhakiella australiensis]OON41346.1 type II secretion system protein [Izhakiella australiensis]
MKTFDVIFLEQGERKTMQITASSAAEARQSVSAQGLTVMRVTARPAGRTKRFSLNLFIQELVALLEAGLVVTEAIEALHASSSEPQARNMLDALLKKLYEGCQLSQAMAALPAVFPPLLVNTVRSSEQTGHLPMALKRFQHYEQRMETLRKRVKATLMYPTIVMAVGGLILIFLLGFIIPRFAVVFEGMKDPDGSARFILWWGRLVENHGMMLLLATCVLGAGLVAMLRTAAVRQGLTNLLLRLPQLRRQHTLTILVRFYRTLGLLLQGGMPVVQALNLTRSILPVSHHAQLQQVLDNVQAGQALSATLETQQMTTPVATRLLQAGERSGQLPEMCERIAAFYDEALERAIEMFSKVFEPLLMMIVGGIVGLVVFLLYMPIFELAGGLS